jgi:hypothetical protein
MFASKNDPVRGGPGQVWEEAHAGTLILGIRERRIMTGGSNSSFGRL